jgi:CspA family cold shock protein
MATYVGAIKSFNAEKGWGFIECAETAAIYGKDIFVMKTSLPASIRIGTIVSFKVTDGKANVEATNVQVQSSGKNLKYEPYAVNRNSSGEAAVYSGVIKSFNSQKGWGLISCDETHQIYGKDIFVLKTSLPGGTADPGETVEFSVIQSEKGPEASNVNMGYVGTIKSFNASKGWGLISCDETFRIFNKDMFVLKTSLPNGKAEVGTRVRFTVFQGAKGPEAGGVSLVTRQHGKPSTGVMVRNGVMIPVALGTWANGSKPAPTVGSDMSQRTYTGTIKSFNADKGWGFVSATGHALNSISKDVFFLRTGLQVPEVSIGDSVEFNVANGQKGLNAIDIRPMLRVDSMTGQVFYGVVKSYNAKKQWGFITGDAVIQTFGRDVFFHGKDLENHIPDVGTEVEFMVTSNNQGQPQATQLNFWSSQAFGSIRSGNTRTMPY